MNEIGPDEERIQINIKPGQRLRKIVLELQDTERTYVKVSKIFKVFFVLFSIKINRFLFLHFF